MTAVDFFLVLSDNDAMYVYVSMSCLILSLPRTSILPKHSILEKAMTLTLWLVSVDLEWKIIYVGSAESEEYDQVLDSVLVGPVPAGRHMFVFQVRVIVGKDCFVFQ